MKIALGGILHETNTFSTVPTEYDDFRRSVGEALLVPSPRCSIEPLFAAHATPSGRVTRRAFDRLLLELLDGIREAMPVDGVLLELHGAMEVEEIGDGETAILEAVRALIGPEPLVCTTLDLHANLAPICAELSDIVVAYRTAPHRDVVETRARGIEALCRAFEDGRRPHTELAKLPLLVAGEAAVTEIEPAKSLYAALSAVDSRSDTLCASILIGCAWTDSPHTTVGTVVSGFKPIAARGAAAELAERTWAVRDRFAIESPTAELPAAISMAMELDTTPVFISDSGDNTTAGAAGDLPTVLRYLVEHRVPGCLVAGVHDSEAVAQCFERGVGAEVDLTVGGRLDTVHDAPYRFTARILELNGDDEIPPRAVVQVAGVDAVLQSDRRPFTELRHFERLGLDPAGYDIIVVKEGYLFPELRDYARSHIMALTPGFADQRLDRLPYERLTRPIHPLDEGVSWEPGA